MIVFDRYRVSGTAGGGVNTAAITCPFDGRLKRVFLHVLPLATFAATGTVVYGWVSLAPITDVVFTTAGRCPVGVITFLEVGLQEGIVGFALVAQSVSAYIDLPVARAQNFFLQGISAGLGWDLGCVVEFHSKK